MNTNPSLLIAQSDHERLSALVDKLDSETAQLLQQELDRAKIVPDAELPADVVAMESRVQFVDVDTGKDSVFTLVYPNHAKVEEGRISILAPVGAALIGLRVGQTIEWPLPMGRYKRLKVVSVLSRALVESEGMASTG